MPKSPEEDLSKIQASVIEKIKSFSGSEDAKVEQEPVAFGLKALKIIFVMDEAKGSLDPLEKDVSAIEGVNSVEVTDVRRALG